MRDRVLKVIEIAIDEINTMREEPVVFTQDLHLIGSKGCYDSLELVSLISTLEDLIADEFYKEIWLVTDKAFSKGNSPFYTVNTLCNYIIELLEGSK